MYVYKFKKYIYHAEIHENQDDRPVYVFGWDPPKTVIREAQSASLNTRV